MLEFLLKLAPLLLFEILLPGKEIVRYDAVHLKKSCFSLFMCCSVIRFLHTLFIISLSVSDFLLFSVDNSNAFLPLVDLAKFRYHIVVYLYL